MYAGANMGHPSREEGLFFARIAAPASPIRPPPCNFYDLSAPTDDFLPNPLAGVRTRHSCGIFYMREWN
jgi:hypothetical protein